MGLQSGRVWRSDALIHILRGVFQNTHACYAPPLNSSSTGLEPVLRSGWLNSPVIPDSSIGQWCDALVKKIP